MELSVDSELLRGLQRRGISPVPSTPIRRALDLAGDERSNNDRLIEHIESSSPLRFGFMAGANLPMFWAGRPITTVRQGVGELGRRKVLSLFWLMALSEFLQSAGRRTTGNDRQNGMLNRFWRHSLLTGVLARQLVHTARFDIQEDALTAGLAHDIGHLLLIFGGPRLEIANLEEPGQAEPDRLLENDISPAPDRLHCQLGASLLEFWNAPVNLVRCALYHHDPEAAEVHQRPLIIAVRLADLLAEHLELHRPIQILRLEAASAWRLLAAMEPWNQVADLDRLALEQLPDALVTADHVARVLS